MTRPLFSIFFLLLFSSCTQHHQGAQPKTPTITIINPGDSSLNFEVYYTKEHFMSKNYAVSSGRVYPEAQVVIAAIQGYPETMYVDVYSDGYTISNWGINTQPVSLLPTPSSTIITTPSFASVGNLRNYFMDSDQSETVWLAVDCFTGQPRHSIWDSITTNQKYKRLILSKESYFNVEQKDGSGNIFSTHGTIDATQTPLRLKVQGTQGYPFPLEHNFQKDSVLMFQHPNVYLLVKQ